MSFALDQQDDPTQDDLDAQKAQSSGSATSLGGGGSGVVSGGAGSGSGAGPSPGASTLPGGWTNLQDYLSANSDQAAQAGSQIASGVNDQAQNAQNDIDSASSDFSNQVNAGSVNADSDAVNKDIAAATGASSSASFDPNAAADFQKQLNASYSGPTDFTQSGGYQKAQGSLNNAQTALNQTQSEAGRDVLLQNQYNNASPNGYNQGEQTLDQALIEGSPQAQSALQGVNGQWSGLGSALSNATTNQNSAAQAAAANTQSTSAAAKAALDKANSDFQGGLNTELTQAQQAQQTAYQNELAAFKNQSWDPSNLDALGLSRDEKIYGVDPTQYLSQGLAPTLETMANPDDYARSAALAQLAGGGAISYLNPANASQAGTTQSPYSFDATGFHNAVSAAQSNLNQQIDKERNRLMAAGQMDSPSPYFNSLLAQLNETLGNPTPGMVPNLPSSGPVSTQPVNNTPTILNPVNSLPIDDKKKVLL